MEFSRLAVAGNIGTIRRSSLECLICFMETNTASCRVDFVVKFLARNLSRLVLAAIGLIALLNIAVAQIQPTAEQMRMIDLLPPA